MTVVPPECAVISLPDIELESQISCTRSRLLAIAPGFTEAVAKAIVDKWSELGPARVQVIVDADPEVCRLGFGDFSALQLLQTTAEKLGTCLHQQRGLRVGVLVTDETTTVFSPVARLIEAGGQPGERLNALRMDTPVITPEDIGASKLQSLNLEPTPLVTRDVEETSADLKQNPPMKFDLARKVRVFNARFEFVDFELQGLLLSRKTVRIPSDLLGLAKDLKAQRLMRSSFQLIDTNSGISEERVVRLKNFITNRFLINLPGYGTVVMRNNKSKFQKAMQTLERYVIRFQNRLKQKLKGAIEANREVLIAALLPGVSERPPARWQRFLGEEPGPGDVERMLRRELSNTFGDPDDLFKGMKLRAVFKGVTYESLNDPEFMRIAREKMPFLDELHEEYDAAKASEQEQLSFGARGKANGY